MVARPHTPYLRALATAVLVAAGVSFAPGRANAGCGDYVTVAGQPAYHHAMPTPPTDDAKPDPMRGPCRGPHCSLSDSTPIPFAPTTVAQPGPTDAILATATPTESQRRGRVHSPSVHVPVRPASAIFHPPRCG